MEFITHHDSNVIFLSISKGIEKYDIPGLPLD